LAFSVPRLFTAVVFVLCDHGLWSVIGVYSLRMVTQEHGEGYLETGVRLFRD